MTRLRSSAVSGPMREPGGITRARSTGPCGRQACRCPRPCGHQGDRVVDARAARAWAAATTSASRRARPRLDGGVLGGQEMNWKTVLPVRRAYSSSSASVVAFAGAQAIDLSKVERHLEVVLVGLEHALEEGEG